jgi:hypothetical protein
LSGRLTRPDHGVRQASPADWIAQQVTGLSDEEENGLHSWRY